jgi:predicted permease
MYAILQIVRHGVRAVQRAPGFVTLVVLILAVSIGATTAAVNTAVGVLLTPLPVHDDSRLVLITKALPAGQPLIPFSTAELRAWEAASQTLDAVAGVQYDGAWPWPAESGSLTFTVTGTTVSADFFEVLGARPSAGRLLRRQDGMAGAEEVAVIGHDLWRGRLAGNRDVIGRHLRLNGRPVRIVGVAPPGFAFPHGADVWQPLRTTPEALNEGWFSLVARLTPETTAAQVNDETAALLERFRSIAAAGRGLEPRTAVVPLRQALIGDSRLVVVLFVAAAVLLFVVGCGNVANLLLVRGTARHREIAVRLALGATRGRLATRLLAEAASLAAAGAALGMLIGFWLQRALALSAPAGLYGLGEAAYGGRVVWLAAACATAGAVMTGIGPALWTARARPADGLRSDPGTGSGSTRGQMGRQTLVGLQLAFALVVTIGAALLLRSLHELQSADLGFVPERLTVVEVPLVTPAYQNRDRRLQFFEELASGMEARPEVAAATPVLLRPFTGTDGWDATFSLEGQGREEASANPGLHLEAVLPNYFSTMDISILGGRAFLDSDREDSEPVVILSRSLARYGWAGSSALGHRIKFGPPDRTAPWMTVVGIVGDVRYRDLDAPPWAIYLPLRQVPFPPRFLIVRASVDAAPVRAMTERIVREIDAAEPVPDAMPVSRLLEGELAGPRFQMLALGVFSVAIVLLAAIGVFGVLSAFVAQRTRELGVRVALGARRRDLRRLVLGKVGWPTLLGLIAGTGAAAITMPLVRPLLFQIGVLDWRAFASSAIVLALVTLVASVVPLRRAGRVDPVALLRGD